MSEPFIAEIRIFAGNFAIRNWAFCDGQLLPIAQNTALFSIIGTTYGGDGRTTMGLPNMQGRAPMHPGRGPGLTPRQLGQRVGVETVALSEAQMPSHSHAIMGNLNDTDRTPIGMYPEQGFLSASADSDSGSVIGKAGNGHAHDNMQPYLTLNFIIALQGLFPSRS